MNYSPEIAAEVRAEMARKQIGPGRLAADTLIPRSRLHRRLSGRLPFNTDELVLVAAVLDVAVSDLIARAEARAAA